MTAYGIVAIGSLATQISPPYIDSILIVPADPLHQLFGQTDRGRSGVFVVKTRAPRRVDGMDLDLGHALAPASRFRNAASPTSEISTHFAWGVASAA